MATENEKLRKNNKRLREEVSALEGQLCAAKATSAQYEKSIERMNKHGAIITETKRKLKLANVKIEIADGCLNETMVKAKHLAEKLLETQSSMRQMQDKHDFQKAHAQRYRDERNSLRDRITKARLSVESLVAVNHPNLNLEPAFRYVDGMSINVTPHFDDAVERTLFHVHSLLK